MKTRSEVRDRERYYRFHRDYGHDTEECYDLKNQIKDLIHRSHLDRFIRKSREPSLHPKRPRGEANRCHSGREYPNHDDALVITARIANTHVNRIMIDTGSSADILYFDTFFKLGMTNRNLMPMTSTLTGFIRDAITPVGIATLPMTFGDEPRSSWFLSW
ncbi:hypothetical protein BHM03_00007115 [Ensete ventricosum]|nr:hypothetical protein BHM03_00007115 [Ensete ventricosum]